MESSKSRILIVEDDVALQGRELERVLVEGGYEVVGIAETGSQAIDMARALRPVVVLVDIELNDGRMAGASAARTIQQETHSQIVFVTGTVTRDIPGFWAEVLKTPDHQFLTKPVDSAQLLATVRRAVGQSRATKPVFLCYSRRDRKYAEEWQEYISSLQGVGVYTWAEIPQIPVADEWRIVLEQNLCRASAAVCLVSTHFLNSAFIRDLEWPVIRKAHIERGLPVILVFVGPVAQEELEQGEPFDLPTINDPTNLISNWSSATRARDCWARVSDQLGV